MNPNIPIALGALYAAVYYLVARSALNDLRHVDPDYSAHLGAAPGVSGKNSFAVIEVLFDKACPKDFYPDRTKRKLSLARWLLLLSPLVGLGMLALILL